MDVDIKLTGSGLQFTGKVTLFQATQIMAFIAKPTGIELASTPITLPTEATLAVDDKAPAIITGEYESPRQAIDMLQAKTNGQKIVAISLFLGASSQNGKILQHDEVIAEFVRAGEVPPALFPRDLKDAVGAGYVYPVDKKSFRLLASADNIAETGFKKSKRKRAVTKTADGEKLLKLTLRPEISTLTLTTSLEGCFDYFDSPTRADQILWILQYSKANNLTELNRLEICYISSKLGGDINSKTYASSNSGNIKNGYISSVGSTISLTIKGERHLAELAVNTKN